MSYYSIEEFFNLNGTYPSHQSSQYAQAFSSSVDAGTIAQGEYLIQDFLPAPKDFLNWDDSFPTSVVPSSSLAQASANLPITLLQNNLSGMSPHSDLDIVANSSKYLPVAAPVPVPHAARAKVALQTMMSFGDKDEEDIHDNAATACELLKITDAHTQVYLDNHVLHPHVQTAMGYSALANASNTKQTTTGRSNKLVIRPISPSTLMALTEPCLMAWCTAFDENLAEPGSSASFPLQSSDYENYVNTKSNAVYNAWGY